MSKFCLSTNWCSVTPPPLHVVYHESDEATDAQSAVNQCPFSTTTNAYKQPVYLLWYCLVLKFNSVFSPHSILNICPPPGHTTASSNHCFMITTFQEWLGSKLAAHWRHGWAPVASWFQINVNERLFFINPTLPWLQRCFGEVLVA